MFHAVFAMPYLEESIVGEEDAKGEKCQGARAHHRHEPHRHRGGAAEAGGTRLRCKVRREGAAQRHEASVVRMEAPLLRRGLIAHELGPRGLLVVSSKQ